MRTRPVTLKTAADMLEEMSWGYASDKGIKSVTHPIFRARAELARPIQGKSIVVISASIAVAVGILIALGFAFKGQILHLFTPKSH